MRLHKSFVEREFDNDRHNISGLKPKPTFTPSLAQVGKEVELFESLVEIDIQKILKDPPQLNHNLKIDQRKALEFLKNDPEIIIKPADKGGGIVILNTLDYEKRVEALLSVKEHYQKVPIRRMDTLKREGGLTIDEGITAGRICEEEGRFLKNDNPITPAFYGLPKIHKNVMDPPLRPIVSIVSCIGSVLEPLSKYVELK
ncbi:hypothetical protein NDU88_007866 [Pleurodeles waltl]|uniref:Uncharacterized protein n=1 Tax=Pleurodeles waltl TaxID=8319 RepID=A0AAV7NW53_PLEWA|nr:hypothetical protein NDU88_007866 [Pleurodeles waltl]